MRLDIAGSYLRGYHLSDADCSSDSHWSRRASSTVVGSSRRGVRCRSILSEHVPLGVIVAWEGACLSMLCPNKQAYRVSSHYCESLMIICERGDEQHRLKEMSISGEFRYASVRHEMWSNQSRLASSEPWSRSRKGKPERHDHNTEMRRDKVAMFMHKVFTSHI